MQLDAGDAARPGHHRGGQHCQRAAIHGAPLLGEHDAQRRRPVVEAIDRLPRVLDEERVVPVAVVRTDGPLRWHAAQRDPVHVERTVVCAVVEVTNVPRVGVRADCGIEYSSRGLAGLFAHPSQVFRPTLYRIASDVLRFNAWARQGAASLIDENATIGDLQAQGRFGPDFFRHYLLPMSSAIWSAAACDAVRLPLAFLLEFFDNHGLLQVRGQPPWRTVTGGSRRYVEALIRPFEDRVRLQAAVDRVGRDGGGVEVHTRDMGWERYDEAVVATHADQALALIEQPDDEEREALGAIPYPRNVATLHTDSRVLPRAAAAWASWNTHVEDCGDRRAPLRMTYHMNRLQRLPDGTDYLVTLNDEDRIDAARVLARHVYEDPVYSTAGLGARKALRAMNGRRRTFYCGAYLGNGFHEDGLRAGVEVGKAIDRRQEAA